MTVEQRQRVEETANELADIIAAVNELAEEVSRIDPVDPFPVEPFTSITSDGDGLTEAQNTLAAVRDQYLDAARQLKYYGRGSKSVGPFPLDAIERFLSKQTSYTPSWVPSDTQKTAFNLRTDIERKLETLENELDELQRLIDSPKRF